MFTIYRGEVSADSDGPVEGCKPVTSADAQALTSHYPELSFVVPKVKPTQSGA